MPALTTSPSSLPVGQPPAAGQRVGGSRPHARPNAWLAAVGIWAALGLLSLASRSLPGAGSPAEHTPRLLYHFVHVVTLGVLTGAVVWVARRTETWRTWSRLGLHVALAAVFAALVAFVGASALRSVSPGTPTMLPLATFEQHFLA